MQEPRKWRELLGVIISDPKEKYRLANELGVHPFTLMHWYYGESSPGPIDLGKLVQALPLHYDTLAPLVAEALEYMMTNGSALLQNDTIPQEFYEQVSRVRMATPISVRFWSLCSLILQQALSQLDPGGLGITLRIIRCMPPHTNGKICSLRQVMGKSTQTWPYDFDSHALLIGKDSLFDKALASRGLIVSDLSQTPSAFAHLSDPIWSIAVCPIIQDERIAGCLQADSTQTDYFTPVRLALFQRYTELLASVFDPIDFYDIQQVELQPMPPSEVQRRHLPSYRQRVAAVLRDAMRRGENIDVAYAEHLVWQRLEEEFLRLMR